MTGENDRNQDGQDRATGHGEGNVLPFRQVRAGNACADVEELLAPWADGGLTEASALRVAAHVQSCAACAAEVTEIRALLSVLHGEFGASAPRHDDAFWQRLAANIATDIDGATGVGPGRAVRGLVPDQPLRAPRPRRDSGFVRGESGADKRRWWQVSAVASAALAAAAALLLMVGQPDRTAQHTAAQAVGGERVGNWFDIPVLQVDDDLTVDGDPLETVDELDDEELELVDSVLGEAGV